MAVRAGLRRRRRSGLRRAARAACKLGLSPGTQTAALNDSKDCIWFILAVSVPLSLLLLGMLRRAYPLRPGLAAATAGLAAAAAAAALLNLFHPIYDASATDLVAPAVAVALVIAANRASGGRMQRTATA